VVLRQVEDMVAGAVKEQPAVVGALLNHELDQVANGVAHALAMRRNADSRVRPDLYGAESQTEPFIFSVWSSMLGKSEFAAATSVKAHWRPWGSEICALGR